MQSSLFAVDKSSSQLQVSSIKNINTISFKTRVIFGNFKPSSESCFTRVCRLLFDDVINIDGTISPNRRVTLEDAWSYIYYMYINNKTHIPEFQAMTNMSTKKADARLFVEVVKQSLKNKIVVQSISNDILVIFINRIIQHYKDELIVPIIFYIQKIVSKGLSLTNIKLITGNISDSNVKIETDPKKVNDSDIIIKFQHQRKNKNVV